MSNRVCRLFFQIVNNGNTKSYSLKPLSAEEIGPGFIAGFRITNVTDSPQPVYLIRVRASGSVHCTCPAYHWDEQKGHEAGSPLDQPEPSCKHIAALEAANAVTRNMIDVLRQRTMLLDQAEQSLQNRDIERQQACELSDRLKSEIHTLKTELAAVSQRAVQLQNALAVAAAVPRRRTRKKVAA